MAPASLRRIGEGAFLDCKALRRVVLNEGLEKLDTIDAVFSSDERKLIRYETAEFKMHADMYPSLHDDHGDTHSETVGPFFGSGGEELTLPSTRMGVDRSTFEDLPALRVVYIHNDLKSSVKRYLSGSVQV